MMVRSDILAHLILFPFEGKDLKKDQGAWDNVS